MDFDQKHEKSWFFIKKLSADHPSKHTQIKKDPGNERIGSRQTFPENLSVQLFKIQKLQHFENQANPGIWHEFSFNMRVFPIFGQN